MKILKFILALFVIFLLIDYFGRSPLVKEIAELEPPAGFLDEIRIDSIAQKYFYLGSTKEQVINQLKTYGFEVYELNGAPLLLECEQCDDIFVRAAYDFKFLLLLPTLRAVIDIGFQDERAIIIVGVYGHLLTWP